MIDHAADVANHIGAIETDLGADHPTGIYYAGKPALGGWLRPVANVLERDRRAPHSTPPRRPAKNIGRTDREGRAHFAPVQDSRFYFNSPTTTERRTRSTRSTRNI